MKKKVYILGSGRLPDYFEGLDVKSVQNQIRLNLYFYLFRYEWVHNKSKRTILYSLNVYI